MGTRVTLKQIFLEPEQFARATNTKNKDEHERKLAAGEFSQQPEELRFSDFIPHVDNGWCQCVNVEFNSGGNPAAGRFRLDLVVFEPVSDDDAS